MLKIIKKRFIPIVAKTDQIKNFQAKYKQLQNMELNNKPCLIINKCQDVKELKNLSDKDEVNKIKEIIPDVDKYPVNIGRKKLIDELIKIQYEKYRENFKNIVDNINIEIKRNEERLDKLPKEFDLDYNKKRDECLNSIKNLKEALKSISSLKNMDNIISFNINDEEEKEEEEDEEDEKNINNNKDN